MMCESDPDWLSRVLSEYERNEAVVRVLSVRTQPAVKPGENFTSDIVRAKVEVVLGSGRVTSRKVIIKKIIGSEKTCPTEISEGFRLESIAFDKILSRCYHLMEENDAPYPKFWPDCIFASSRSIILEDLSRSGFEMAERRTGLDEDRAKLAVINLARLHSLSWMVAADGDSACKELPSWIQSRDGPLEMWFGLPLRILADFVRDEWGPSWSRVEKKIRCLAKDIVPTVKRLYSEPHPVTVVCHGDCWVNNMMFRRGADGKPVEQKLIDFQTVFYNSYAWDLAYFLHTSLNARRLASSYGSLIRTYSDEFSRNLTLCGRDASAAPAVDQVEREMVRLRPFSLAVATAVLPVTSNPSDITMDIEDMVDPVGKKFRLFYESEPFQIILREMLEYFDDLGMFP